MIEAAIAENRRFHAQPLEAKLAMGVNQNLRGYIKPKAIMIKHSTYHDHTVMDNNETTVFATDYAPDHPGVVAGKQFYGQNQCPMICPVFAIPWKTRWRPWRRSAKAGCRSGAWH